MAKCFHQSRILCKQARPFSQRQIYTKLIDVHKSRDLMYKLVTSGDMYLMMDIALCAPCFTPLNVLYDPCTCQHIPMMSRLVIVYRMGRLCGGAHEISGIKAPLFLCGWVG